MIRGFLYNFNRSFKHFKKCDISCKTLIGKHNRYMFASEAIEKPGIVAFSFDSLLSGMVTMATNGYCFKFFKIFLLKHDSPLNSGYDLQILVIDIWFKFYKHLK